ncbi:hypothetical protein HMPREF2617_10370 [Corynebacterium sp. HMSC070H05]|uniref:alpha/beta hydrolase n=1 Tax=Corynebacterium sp. HMSC070H05 TaxID=1715096 RepID=UPI0008A8CABC|nr:alpha/beta hydrolase-fold protein [Corynebacterium sp. HMSC070H05]OHQ52588.1 hypothetical protein HMPREF2617_10370 [Corynebacterium sp. HMSC070H05]
METLRSIPVVGGTAAVVIYVALAVCVVVVAVLVGRRRLRWAVLGAAALMGVVVFALTVWPKPFPDSIPLRVYASWAVGVFAVVAAIVGRRRLLLAVVAVPAVVFAFLGTNLQYQQYPTLGSFHPVRVTVAMSLEQFERTDTAPQLHGREVGALVTVPAPPERDAVVYVPPAYWHGATLPVLVLMSGSPGSPMGWFTDGQAAETADAYQQEHGGISPIVVSVDATGSATGNPACVDGPDAAMHTYLSSDIPALLKDTFRVNPDQSTWTIGGLSYGGTCSLQVVTNSPEAYGSFLDFSGEPEPSLGNHDKTVNELFGGDEDAFKAINPADLLANAKGADTYRGIAGRFVAGENDKMASTALPHLNDLARAAGMDTTYTELPGAHSYQVWRVALRENFEFVAHRGGLK